MLMSDREDAHASMLPGSREQYVLACGQMPAGTDASMLAHSRVSHTRMCLGCMQWSGGSYRKQPGVWECHGTRYPRKSSSVGPRPESGHRASSQPVLTVHNPDGALGLEGQPGDGRALSVRALGGLLIFLRSGMDDG